MTQQQIKFIEKTLQAAAYAGKVYGVNVIGMMAQAAIETGWGKSTPGNMWFGIKATPSWTGATQQLWTTEYINGEAQRVKATFRAYPSAHESFLDYAKLISSQSRYAAALNYSGYGQVEQYLAAITDGGYATDPNYLSKLKSIANTIKSVVSEADITAALKKKTVVPGVVILSAIILSVIIIKQQ